MDLLKTDKTRSAERIWVNLIGYTLRVWGVKGSHYYLSCEKKNSRVIFRRRVDRDDDV